jgi:hypothetical protein
MKGDTAALLFLAETTNGGGVSGTTAIIRAHANSLHMQADG